MLPVFSIKKAGRGVLVTLLLLVSSGCNGFSSTAFTLGEWIQEVVEKTGIAKESSSVPYFDAIDEESECFASVQAAVEYGILDEKVHFEEDIPLTREWLAYTVARFALPSDQTCKGSIHDLSDCAFPKETETAVSIGLMEMDKSGCFHPKKKVSQKEAEEVLQKAIEVADHRIIAENRTDIQMKDEGQTETVSALTDDRMNLILTMNENRSFSEGSILKWKDPVTGENRIGRIRKIVTEEGTTHIHYDELDLLEESESMHLSGSVDLDFLQCELIDGNGEIIRQAQWEEISAMSYYAFSKSYDLAGYRVTISAGASGLKASVRKTLVSGTVASADIRLSNVHCDYEWLSEEKNLKDVYFKVCFDSEENAGVKTASYSKKIADFARMKPDDFLGSIRNMFVDSSDAEVKTLTLAEVRMPIPGSPLMNVSMRIDMTVYLSGKIELTLRQANTLGCEIRNGHMRMIRSVTPKVSSEILASSKLLGAVRVGVNLSGMKLCDMGIQAGAEASVKPVLHLFDEKGKKKSESVTGPLDAIDELAYENENVLVCADYTGNLIGQVQMNSSSTILGKLGLSGTYSLFSSGNANLIPEGYRHMENMQFVKECTRKDRSTDITYDSLQVSDQIRLERYALAISTGGYRTIRVTGLPEGYVLENLIYESNDPEIAIVSSGGRITGKKPGSTEIAVTTDDGKYSICLSVLIKT